MSAQIAFLSMSDLPGTPRQPGIRRSDLLLKLNFLLMETLFSQLQHRQRQNQKRERNAECLGLHWQTDQRHLASCWCDGLSLGRLTLSSETTVLAKTCHPTAEVDSRFGKDREPLLSFPAQEQNRSRRKMLASHPCEQELEKHQGRVCVRLSVLPLESSAEHVTAYDRNTAFSWSGSASVES